MENHWAIRSEVSQRCSTLARLGHTPDDVHSVNLSSLRSGTRVPLDLFPFSGFDDANHQPPVCDGDPGVLLAQSVRQSLERLPDAHRAATRTSDSRRCLREFVNDTATFLPIVCEAYWAVLLGLYLRWRHNEFTSNDDPTQRGSPRGLRSSTRSDFGADALPTTCSPVPPPGRKQAMGTKRPMSATVPPRYRGCGCVDGLPPTPTSEPRSATFAERANELEEVYGAAATEANQLSVLRLVDLLEALKLGATPEHVDQLYRDLVLMQKQQNNVTPPGGHTTPAIAPSGSRSKPESMSGTTTSASDNVVAPTTPYSTSTASRSLRRPLSFLVGAFSVRHRGGEVKDGNNEGEDDGGAKEKAATWASQVIPRMCFLKYLLVFRLSDWSDAALVSHREAYVARLAAMFRRALSPFRFPLAIRDAIAVPVCHVLARAVVDFVRATGAAAVGGEDRVPREFNDEEIGAMVRVAEGWITSWLLGIDVSTHHHHHHPLLQHQEQQQKRNEPPSPLSAATQDGVSPRSTHANAKQAPRLIENSPIGYVRMGNNNSPRTATTTADPTLPSDRLGKANRGGSTNAAPRPPPARRPSVTPVVRSLQGASISPSRGVGGSLLEDPVGRATTGSGAPVGDIDDMQQALRQLSRAARVEERQRQLASALAEATSVTSGRDASTPKVPADGAASAALTASHCLDGRPMPRSDALSTATGTGSPSCIESPLGHAPYQSLCTLLRVMEEEVGREYDRTAADVNRASIFIAAHQKISGSAPSSSTAAAPQHTTASSTVAHVNHQLLNHRHRTLEDLLRDEQKPDAVRFAEKDEAEWQRFDVSQRRPLSAKERCDIVHSLFDKKDSALAAAAASEASARRKTAPVADITSATTQRTIAKHARRMFQQSEDNEARTCRNLEKRGADLVRVFVALQHTFRHRNRSEEDERTYYEQLQVLYDALEDLLNHPSFLALKQPLRLELIQRATSVGKELREMRRALWRTLRLLSMVESDDTSVAPGSRAQETA